MASKRVVPGGSNNENNRFRIAAETTLFEFLTLPERLAKFTQAITGLLKTPGTFSAADAAFEAMQGAELLLIWTVAHTMRVIF